MPVAKTKVLISHAVTAQLICGFVFTYAYCWFFYAVAQHWVCQKKQKKQIAVLVRIPYIWSNSGLPKTENSL